MEIPIIPNLIYWAIPIFLVSVIFEGIIIYKKRPLNYNIKDTLASLSMGIGNILVEELALGALTSMTGGAAAPALGASVATIPSKLKNLFSLTRFGSASKNLIKNLDNVEKAKDFWGRTQAGRDFIGDIFLPNTTAAVKNSRTAANTADNAMNMAKSRPMAIELYSDFRDLNFAVAEAKLELVSSTSFSLLFISFTNVKNVVAIIYP